MKKRTPARSIDTPWGSDFIFILRRYAPLRTYEEISNHIDTGSSHFKRIKIPLIRRLYPQLLWTNP